MTADLDLARRPLSTLSRNEASRLTQKIRDHAEKAWDLLRQAHEQNAWAPLGYTSFESYVAEEFGMSRGNAYRLIGQSQVIGELTQAAGLSRDVPVVVSERAAAEIKPALDVVAKTVVERTKGRPRRDRPGIVEATVAEARDKIAGPPVTSDQERLINAVADWASSHEISFHDAVERLIKRLAPETKTSRPDPGLSRARDRDAFTRVGCDGVHHPPNRRMGNVCMACMKPILTK